MSKKYNVDQDLKYKSLFEKIDLSNSNGFYIFGKSGVGKTTFGKQVKEIYGFKKQCLYDKINKLEQEYEKQNQLYKQRLKNNNIKITHYLNAMKKYGSYEEWQKIECSFPENLEMNKIINEKEKTEQNLKKLQIPIFLNMQKFISNIQSSWAKKYTDAINNIEIEITKATNANLLILDDFGVEFIHESTYPYIYELFEKRYENLEHKNLTTIITSNYSLMQLKNKYLKKLNDEIAIERLFSRIEGLLNEEIEFLGSDKRKNKL